MHFGKNTIVFTHFPSASFQGYMLIYLIIGNVNFGCLIKVVSGIFLHCKVIVLPFVINKYLEVRRFETMEIFCFASYFCSPILGSTDAIIITLASA